MPITDYALVDRIFFAKEFGEITQQDAQEWADKLKEATVSSDKPIIALVDAMSVTGVHRNAVEIFRQCADTENLLVSIVATNVMTSVQANVIGRRVKRGQTIIFSSLEVARQRAKEILETST